MNNGLENKMLFTVKELSPRINISESQLYDYAKTGIIKPIYLPSAKPSKSTKRNRKAIRFSLEAIQQFLHNLGVDGFDTEGV